MAIPAKLKTEIIAAAREAGLSAGRDARAQLAADNEPYPFNTEGFGEAVEENLASEVDFLARTSLIADINDLLNRADEGEAFEAAWDLFDTVAKATALNDAIKAGAVIED